MFIDSSTSTSTSFSASTSGSTSTTSYIQSFYQKVRELAAEAGLTPLHLAAYSGLEKTHHFFHIISVNHFAPIYSICPSRPNHHFISVLNHQIQSCVANATRRQPLLLDSWHYLWLWVNINGQSISIWLLLPPPFPLLQYVPVIMDNRKKNYLHMLFSSGSENVVRGLLNSPAVQVMNCICNRFNPIWWRGLE